MPNPVAAGYGEQTQFPIALLLIRFWSNGMRSPRLLEGIVLVRSGWQRFAPRVRHSPFWIDTLGTPALEGRQVHCEAPGVLHGGCNQERIYKLNGFSCPLTGPLRS
jgi:hypothetical protein